MDVKIILSILFAHWFADFMVQPEDWAINKSKSIKKLFFHCLVYSVSIFSVVVVFMGIIDQRQQILMLWWAFFNGIAHFVVDLFTSKMNAELWKEDKHLFFINVGLDQLIHLVILFLSYFLLCNFGFLIFY